MSSDSDEVDDPGVRRSKRTKKATTSEEDELEKVNEANKTRKAVVSEEDKPGKENQVCTLVTWYVDLRIRYFI